MKEVAGRGNREAEEEKRHEETTGFLLAKSVYEWGPGTLGGA